MMTLFFFCLPAKAIFGTHASGLRHAFRTLEMFQFLGWVVEAVILAPFLAQYSWRIISMSFHCSVRLLRLVKLSHFEVQLSKRLMLVASSSRVCVSDSPTNQPLLARQYSSRVGICFLQPFHQPSSLRPIQLLMANFKELMISTLHAMLTTARVL
jgi:hypothetical protein